MAQLSKYDALNTILQSLSASSGDIEASAVVSADGLLMASNFPADMDEERMAAMAAALLAIGERASTELRRGQLEQVFIRGANGFVVMMSAGPDGVLTVMCNKMAKLGLIFLDMKRAAAEIAKIL
jgi:predicted regulator of Ras-like GTPase activity (Roadblock/LC7/MglB family)